MQISPSFKFFLNSPRFRMYRSHCHSHRLCRYFHSHLIRHLLRFFLCLWKGFFNPPYVCVFVSSVIWYRLKFKICFQTFFFPDTNNIIRLLPMLWYSNSDRQRGIVKIWIILFSFWYLVGYFTNLLHSYLFSHTVVITYKFFQFC